MPVYSSASCLQGYSWYVQFMAFCHVSLWMHFQFSGYYASGINESKSVPLLVHQALTLHLLLYLLLPDLHLNSNRESSSLVKGQMGRLPGLQPQ